MRPWVFIVDHWGLLQCYLDKFWFEKSHVEMSHDKSIRRIMNTMRMNTTRMNTMRMRIQVQEMFTMMNTMMKNHAKVVSNRPPLKYFTVRRM